MINDTFKKFLPLFAVMLLLSACSITVNTNQDSEDDDIPPPSEETVIEEEAMEEEPVVEEEEGSMEEQVMEDEITEEKPMEEEEPMEEETMEEGTTMGEKEDDVMEEESMESSSVESESGEVGSDSANNEEEEVAVRTIRVEHTFWEFTPSVITAKRGEKVQLELVGVEGTHGFAVPELGIDTEIAQGETKYIDLPTDTVGTFDLRCSVVCGVGHFDMIGTIVIEE